MHAGSSPEKTQLRIVHNPTTGQPGVSDDVAKVSRDISNTEILRDCLAVRAYTCEVAGVATVLQLNKLTAIYEEAMTQIPPLGYRCPTIKEVLRADRNLWTETLTFLLQG